jgi:hypothetical protein
LAIERPGQELAVPSRNGRIHLGVEPGADGNDHAVAGDHVVQGGILDRLRRPPDPTIGGVPVRLPSTGE